MVLEVSKVRKVYKKKRNTIEVVAVDDISFGVKAGEILGLLGPNGAGKSTLIKMIVGLALPNEGTITIQGVDVFSSERIKVMGSVGAVIEAPDMYANKSADWVLKYFASLHDRESLIGDDLTLNEIKSKIELDKVRVEQVLELVQLLDRRHSKVKTFSMGMKQRLGIAQALLNNPKLLILDEPANGLDPSGIKEIRDLLRLLADKKNMAILVSSHQLAEMEFMCDRVIIINEGKIVSENLIKSRSVDWDESVEVEYELLCNDAVKAKEFLLDKWGITAEKIGEKLVFSTNVKKAQINKELVLFGIEVESLDAKKQTLEELFLSATNSNKKWGQ